MKNNETNELDPRPSLVTYRGKRSFDFALAALALLLLSPVLLLLLVWIPLDSRGPAVYRQIRIGSGNRPFTIYKFRTMRTDTPEVATDQLSDPTRYVTRLGHWLRKTSLDELPQLVNILKGEMSFVGPRPALYNQYELIDKRTVAGVHALRPGLSGHAQVNGRDDLSDEEKVLFDGEYLQRIGFREDMRIIWRSIYLAAISRGVRQR